MKEKNAINDIDASKHVYYFTSQRGTIYLGRSAHKLTSLLAILFCLVTFSVYPAWAVLPENHEEYMDKESYKEAFEQFKAGMSEAIVRLTPDEYRILEKEGDEVIIASVKEDMKSGIPEADAYETAYWMRYEQVSKELRRDWLRKNAKGAQGFYKLRNSTFDGYMALEKGYEDNEYAVEIFVVMKTGPKNEANFYGLGKFSGGRMTVQYNDDDNAVTITFIGETAIVLTSRAFKERGWRGTNVIFDGEYLRERRQ